jgi:hypothetical protein
MLQVVFESNSSSPDLLYHTRGASHYNIYDELIAAGPQGIWWLVPSPKAINVSVSMVRSVNFMH